MSDFHYKRHQIFNLFLLPSPISLHFTLMLASLLPRVASLLTLTLVFSLLLVTIVYSLLLHLAFALSLSPHAIFYHFHSS